MESMVGSFVPMILSAVSMTLCRAFLSACVVFPYQTVMPAKSILPWATCNNPWNTDRCVDLTSVNLTATRSGNHTVNVTSGNLTSSVSEFWERGVLSMSGVIEEVGTVQWELVLCLLACWVTCYYCIWRGVRSTGKVAHVSAVWPYIMLAVLLVRGLTLPGAWLGVIFYLYPEPSRLADLQVWMEACAQVLFSYGVAAGAIITLGSYNKVNNNCYKDTLWLCALNSGTSLVVFSSLGFMAQAQGTTIDMVVDSGPGLAFIAFPQAVAMMPLLQLWGACFFIMLIMLRLDTVFTGLETVISSVTDIFPEMLRRLWRREILLLLFCLICFITQIPLTTQGGVYLFQLIDYYGCSGACLLFVSLIQCVTVGWSFGAERLCDAVEDMSGQRPCVLFKLCWQYITPLICMVCFVGSFLDHKPLKSGDYVYPHWAYYLGWAIALSSVVLVPMWAVGKVCLSEGTLKHHLMLLWVPVAEPDVTKTTKLHAKLPSITSSREAIVTPIFKSGDRNIVTNYRPISILPVISKIVEKIVINQLTDHIIMRQLKRLHAGKSAGPDGVSPRVLKACSLQLCGVLQHIFSLSLSLHRVPVLWKTSCIVPVPKIPRPSGSKDYRPVALTSHIMKTLERLILDQLRPMVRPLLDPLQFAYQPRLGVEDAIIYLLDRVYAHLDKPASTVRVMFFDFSSAFNTIRPALLSEKLTAMRVEPPLVSWIVDYLTGRPHCCTETCHLQKFSDDSAVVGLISKGEETEYRGVVDNFVTWC
ncbi:sodium- and chloride-dependent betaine transporter-like [Solea solea]|uniref:sodium- and chloride-dependent betaine transporter-like n=1 Tax=Solea solea TaxID=90069 RepID=UPI00272D90B2|nr:sodium- and chloride-dependent betaine transporter-like [Solea solea]